MHIIPLKDYFFEVHNWVCFIGLITCFECSRNYKKYNVSFKYNIIINEIVKYHLQHNIITK